MRKVFLLLVLAVFVFPYFVSPQQAQRNGAYDKLTVRNTLNGNPVPVGAFVGTSDSQTLTNKIFDISANTLNSSSNTAGHYPRNNGTQYVDNTIQAGDVPQINLAASGNGGIGGVLPVANEGTGTPAAGKYVDGGTGAWTAIPATGLSTVYNTTASATNASIGSTSMVTSPASDTNYRFSFEIAQTQATSGCSVAPNISVSVTYTEAFRNTSVNLEATIASDSGVPSSTGSSNFASSLTHYVYFGHLDFRAKASTAISYFTTYFAGSGCGTGANYSIAPALVQE